MIWAATFAELEERRLKYILGARERSDAVVRKILLENDDPFIPLLIERKAGENPIETLFAKLRALLRKAAEWTIDVLWKAIGTWLIPLSQVPLDVVLRNGRIAV